MYILEQHLLYTPPFLLQLYSQTLELSNSDKPNITGLHYQTKNKIITHGTLQQPLLSRSNMLFPSIYCVHVTGAQDNLSQQI